MQYGGPNSECCEMQKICTCGVKSRDTFEPSLSPV